MIKKIAVISIAIGALLAVAFTLSVVAFKPVSTDLSLVGQGKPALVLALENYSPAGAEALDRLRQVRSDYEARLAFLVADLGTPQGREFADRYRLIDGYSVFLRQDGEALWVAKVPEGEAELRALLEQKLAAVE